MTETASTFGWNSEMRSVYFGGVRCLAADTPWGVIVKLPGGSRFAPSSTEQVAAERLSCAAYLQCSRHCIRRAIRCDGQVLIFPHTFVTSNNLYGDSAWYVTDVKLAEVNVSPNLEPSWELRMHVQCPICRLEIKKVMSDAFRQYELTNRDC